MSLATRCTACGTVFRVVQDQLRVSEGWVRCGRCNGVFDATEVLFDIDSGAPVKLPPTAAGLDEAPLAAPAAAASEMPAWSAPASADTALAEPALASGGSDLSPGPADPLFAEPQPAAHGAGQAWQLPPHGEPLLRAPSRGNDDEHERIVITDHVPNEPKLLADAPGAELTAAAALGTAAPHRIDPSLSTATPVQAAPTFLRSTAASSGWRGPLRRASLWLAMLALALAALLQGAVLWRDALAAAWPTAKPALQALCRVAGCSVLPLRRLESLSVESSSLNRLDGSALYRLQLVLHNQGATVVMMPSLELTLNDGQGQLVARRVMATAELGLPQTALAPGQSLPVLALLSTGERRVDGYTLELFYP